MGTIPRSVGERRVRGGAAAASRPAGAGQGWTEAGAGDVTGHEPLARLVAHESRTPLNAIIGFAELLLAGGAGPLGAEARDAVAEIARAARDLESAMATAGVLIELGAVPPRARAGPVVLAPLLRTAGFALDEGPPASATVGEDERAPLVVLGNPDRWAAILGAVRGFLLRRAERHAACRARPLLTRESVGLRLWAEPGPLEFGDLGRLELALAARLAAGEGADLSLGRRGEIRLAWPAERVPEPRLLAAAVAPAASSDVT